jgi:hypothetical protein
MRLWLHERAISVIGAWISEKDKGQDEQIKKEEEEEEANIISFLAHWLGEFISFSSFVVSNLNGLKTGRFCGGVSQRNRLDTILAIYNGLLYDQNNLVLRGWF